jgi:8-amino-7-oxononanoate synthase
VVSLEQYARDKLDALDARSLRRVLVETDRFRPGLAHREGREVVSFCCNDYLNLSHHPDVIKASLEATRRYGVGSGASRLVTGNHPLYTRLEARLARLKGSADARVFGSGYLANLGIIPSLVGTGDLVLADVLSHACLFGGAQLSGAALRVFRHNDLEHCEEILRNERGGAGQCLVLTDGVFSMDGDRAPLGELQTLCERFDAWLLSDDAHGLGVVEGGRGSGHRDGAPLSLPLQMGTLSKAVGAYGGYVCASEAVISLLTNRARTLVYTTGLPPATVAAADAALEIIEHDAELVAKPLTHAARFCRRLGLPAPESCIVPILLGDADRALAASRALLEAGFLVTAIRPPTVPERTARLRCTFCAAHRVEEIDALADAVAPWCEA